MRPAYRLSRLVLYRGPPTKDLTTRVIGWIRTSAQGLSGMLDAAGGSKGRRPTRRIPPRTASQHHEAWPAQPASRGPRLFARRARLPPFHVWSALVLKLPLTVNEQPPRVPRRGRFSKGQLALMTDEAGFGPSTRPGADGVPVAPAARGTWAGGGPSCPSNHPRPPAPSCRPLAASESAGALTCPSNSPSYRHERRTALGAPLRPRQSAGR